jgi:signal peptidase I
VTAESRVRRLARAVLTRAAGAGSTWVAAVVGELDAAPSNWAALRWTVSGLRVAWWERRQRREGAGVPVSSAQLAQRIVLITVTLIVALVTVNWRVATVLDIPSASMSPTLRVDDRVLVDKVGFHMTGLHRGDVVVVAMPLSHRFLMVKRLVGLPGDRIECRDDAVYRNGVPIPGTGPGPLGCAPVTVPAGSLYLLGDDSTVSEDSRQLGPVAQSNVVGRVVGRVWPVTR